MAVNTNRRCGIRVESTYYFMSVFQFRQFHSLEPKALGLRITPLKIEDGVRVIKGIVFKPTPSMHISLDQFRKVVLFHETGWSLDEHLRQPKERLRENEPMEVFQQLNKEKMSSRPADFQCCHCNSEFSSRPYACSLLRGWFYIPAIKTGA